MSLHREDGWRDKQSLTRWSLGVHTEVVIVPGRENKCSCYVIFVKYVDLFLNHSGTALISAEECI